MGLRLPYSAVRLLDTNVHVAVADELLRHCVQIAQLLLRSLGCARLRVRLPWRQLLRVLPQPVLLQCLPRVAGSALQRAVQQATDRDADAGVRRARLQLLVDTIKGVVGQKLGIKGHVRDPVQRLPPHCKP